MNVASSALGLRMSVKSGEEEKDEDDADTGLEGDACFFPDRVAERCCGLALTASLSRGLVSRVSRDVTRLSVKRGRQKPASGEMRLDGYPSLRRIR